MIQTTDLRKSYGYTTVVKDINLFVATGELLVLLGASGSGKTTTLKMLNRLIEPTSGIVQVNGTDTTATSPHELRRQIGYVFQQSALFPHMTVRENIGVTPALLEWPNERITKRIDELMNLVELSSQLGGRFPYELSGGQQQRVGVARALAASPCVMLLDEPFGSLDALTRERLQESFLRIHKSLSLTTILVTHDMTEALMMGDRIGVLRDGALLQIAPPRELLSNPIDSYVKQLMDTPRRQAAMIDTLADLSPHKQKNIDD
tara:strand:+ start:298 stop:1083 length:786 start_codon:yes stop_codon:yes gene_type:complete